MMPIAELRNLLEQAFPEDEVHLDTPDHTHYQCVIVSARFKGKTPVERHQMVYKALGNAMDEDVHALSLRTYTPDQWKNLQART